jgi:hypothetical protein
MGWNWILTDHSRVSHAASPCHAPSDKASERACFFLSLPLYSFTSAQKVTYYLSKLSAIHK